MKKPTGLSIDPSIWQLAKGRAKELGLSAAVYIEQLIRHDVARGGAINVVADQSVFGGGAIINNHGAATPQRPRGKPNEKAQHRVEQRSRQD